MRQIEYNNPAKVYVYVNVDFAEDGRMIPRFIVWEDGRRFEVDEVLDVCRAASRRAGGVGERYLCKIAGKEVPLYFESPKWFMERK